MAVRTFPSLGARTFVTLPIRFPFVGTTIRVRLPTEGQATEWIPLRSSGIPMLRRGVRRLLRSTGRLAVAARISILRRLVLRRTILRRLVRRGSLVRRYWVGVAVAAVSADAVRTTGGS